MLSANNNFGCLPFKLFKKRAISDLFLKTTERQICTMKRTGLIMIILACVLVSSCSNRSGENEIYVISRENGSGTRSVFVSLFDIIDDEGYDATTGYAEKTTSSSVLITTVAGNKSSIGYVSFGSLSDSVKTVSVDGEEPTAENIKSGRYKLYRPFNICFKESQSELSKDFVSFILSTDGSKIIEKEGLIATSNHTHSYSPAGLSGKLTLSGSTSVSPVIDRLADEYKKSNPGVEIEIQQSGSGAGIQSAESGISDIGMSSRDLTAGESQRLISINIAYDGIAVVINKNNSIDNLYSEEIRDIYLGKLTNWKDLMLSRRGGIYDSIEKTK